MDSSAARPGVDRAGPLQLGLGRELVVVDAEQGEVGADQIDHRRHRAVAEQRQPLAFVGGGEPVAIFRRQRGADRHQIIARVHALGDVADVLAQRLAVAQVDRAGERVDLRAGVVDVIFAGDFKAARFEQAGERVADHRAAAMAHVQRPGRVGRDIFDVDPLALADRRAAVGVAFAEDRAKLVAPGIGRELEVDEARPRHLDRGDRGKRLQLGRDQPGERARVGARRLGQHHRRIGRKVAVRGVARRLDRDRPPLEPGRQRAVGFKLVEHSVEKLGISRVKAQISHQRCGVARPSAAIRVRHHR